MDPYKLYLSNEDAQKIFDEKYKGSTWALSPDYHKLLIRKLSEFGEVTATDAYDTYSVNDIQMTLIKDVRSRYFIEIYCSQDEYEQIQRILNDMLSQ